VNFSSKQFVFQFLFRDGRAAFVVYFHPKKEVDFHVILLF